MFAIPPDGRLRKFCVKARTIGTFENYAAKTFLGFAGGMFLTYILLMFLTIQLNYPITGATMICSALGVFLTLGLAFSKRVRVITLLLLPHLFSKNGRKALVAYAFTLALTGPAVNTLRNTRILADSLACAQEQLKKIVHDITEAVKKPFIAIKDAFHKVMVTIKQVVKTLKEVWHSFVRIFISLLQVMKSVYQWLTSVLNLCNKKVGTPHQRCMRVIDNSVADCHAKLGPLFNWLCSVTYVGSIVCYAAKIFDLICPFMDYINNSVVGVMKKKLLTFVTHIHNIFYVSVDFKHSFHFETTQSVSMKEISAAIIAELRGRTDKFVSLFEYLGFAFIFFFFVLFFRVIQYHLKFLTSNRFENRFITRYFREIDLQRAKHDKETVLPLTRVERKNYITVGSLRFAPSEKRQLIKSAVFLGASSLQLAKYLLTDYCFYWVLALIQAHGGVKTTVEAPYMVGIHVQGSGMVADLYHSIANALKPLGAKMDIDNVPCLPNPVPPDFGRYIQIVSLILLCWVLTILEPYGLRLKHVVMSYYYPERARQRAVWLYNNILRSRGGFLKFIRRQLRRKFGKSKDGVIEKVSLMDRLRAKFPWLDIILWDSKQKMCILCGKVVRKGDKEQLIICPTPNCCGQYCTECYADLKNLCTICKKPTEYGDLSDESIERDSSEEDCQGSQTGVRNRKQKHRFMDEMSKNWPADDAEVGLLSPDETMNVKRERLDSELSYSYQYDADDEADAVETPTVSSPPLGEVETQHIYEPARTEFLYEEERE
ncbi:DC-STAMP domain-containing protein 2 [Cryptotermes secundus]|uniref:DC-STAMP domain-containing protein 2 n=1 Tax=Cryptotermes secundus TaxID=105785 RepID=UPI001454DCDB|nr:DC-STAMP domain-containing protein 2 [Cryptotermes secundus]